MRVIKFIGIFLLLLPIASRAQVDSAISKLIFAKLKSYSKNHIVEKAYLHFDKPYYAAGDTIYFKAYVTVGNEHQLSALSGILHAELISNTNNRILQSENLEITSGVTWGDFALPDTLPKGTYRVRAYTRWMRNNGEPGFFEQTIPVAAVRANTSRQNKTAANNISKAKPDIQFFPEGGNLIIDVRSRIAFKAIGTNGLGMAAEGEVVDNENKHVSTLKTTHLGMGDFFLKPRQGKTYTVKIKYANGMGDTIALPKANDTGIALAVKDDSVRSITIKLTAGKTCYQGNRNKNYTLCIQSGDKLNYLIFKLDTPELSVKILKRDLQPGINRITLFSPVGEPLNERLIFNQVDDQLKLKISSDKTSYSKREKVTVSLSALKKENKPVMGDFSVAVTDENKLPVDEDAESTILNNLLLTSDLKGYVEQPNYYFSSTSTEVILNLDLLMLTQGYRHFEWKKVMNDNDQQPVYQPEHLFSLTGTVKTPGGKPAPKSEVSLALIKQLLARDTTTDVNGNFEFDNLDIADTAKLLLRVKGNRTIAINNPDYPEVTPISSYNADTTSQKIKPEIADAMKKRYEQSGNMKTGITLKQVDIKSRKEHPWDTPLVHSDNLNGPGRADQVIMGDQLKSCGNIIECLYSLIKGGVRIGSGGLIYSLHTPIALNGNTKPMIVILDGLPIRQDQLIAEGRVNYTDVYSIEILKSYMYLTIYGSEAAAGAIVITTKHGGESNDITMQPGLTTYNFNGFYKARQFYSPKYEVQTPANNKPDVRTTIYWQPVLITDKDGNASFDYYNADGPGTYRVVIEGIDGEGNIGRQVYRYKVE